MILSNQLLASKKHASYWSTNTLYTACMHNDVLYTACMHNDVLYTACIHNDVLSTETATCCTD